MPVASMFLLGRQQEVTKRLNEAMEAASQRLAFEQAAVYRDQIQSLHQVQEKQYVLSSKGEDIDIVVGLRESGQLCVNLAMVRGGRHLGDRPLFPVNAGESTVAEAIATLSVAMVIVSIQLLDTALSKNFAISWLLSPFHCTASITTGFFRNLAIILVLCIYLTYRLPSADLRPTAF